jgi:hypothetical protein
LFLVKKKNPNDATSAPSLNTVEVAFDSTQINTFFENIQN